MHFDRQPEQQGAQQGLELRLKRPLLNLGRNHKHGKQDKIVFCLNGGWHMLRQDGAATMLRSRFQLEAKTQTQEKQTVNELYEFI